MMYLVTNGKLITRDEGGRGYYERGAVAFEGSLITEVGEEAALRAKYPEAEIIDAKGGVIMPALINAHTHIYSALPWGLSINGCAPPTSTRCWMVSGGALTTVWIWRPPAPAPRRW